MLYTNKVPLTWTFPLKNGEKWTLYIQPEHCFFYKNIVRAFDVKYSDGTYHSYKLMPNNTTQQVLKVVASPIINHPDATYWVATRAFPLVGRIVARLMGAKKDVKEMIDHLDRYFVENSSYYNVLTHELYLRDKLVITNLAENQRKKISGDA